MSEPATVPAAACRRHAVRGPLLAVAGWLTAAVAALAVVAVPWDIGESLCGVWGCFPPAPALAAMHLFWCAVFGAGVHAVYGGRPVLLRPAGAVLLLAGAAAAVAVVGTDLNRWLANMPDEYCRFWPRRVGYTLVTATDIPLAQSLAAGVACLLLARRVKRSTPEVRS